MPVRYLTDEEAAAADHFESVSATRQESELYHWANKLCDGHEAAAAQQVQLEKLFYPHMKCSQQIFIDSKLSAWSVGYYACCALRGGMPEKRIREIIQVLIG